MNETNIRPDQKISKDSKRDRIKFSTRFFFIICIAAAPYAVTFCLLFYFLPLAPVWIKLIFVAFVTLIIVSGFLAFVFDLSDGVSAAFFELKRDPVLYIATFLAKAIPAISVLIPVLCILYSVFSLLYFLPLVNRMPEWLKGFIIIITLLLSAAACSPIYYSLERHMGRWAARLYAKRWSNRN